MRGFKIVKDDGIYFVIDRNGGIVGSGETRESAIEDAKENLCIDYED